MSHDKNYLALVTQIIFCSRCIGTLRQMLFKDACGLKTIVQRSNLVISSFTRPSVSVRYNRDLVSTINIYEINSSLEAKKP